MFAAPLQSEFIKRFFPVLNNPRTIRLPLDCHPSGFSPNLGSTSLSKNDEIISAWIEEAARSIQDYQSVRSALADLLQSSTTRHQLKTTWTGGSGTLPTSLTLPDCQTQAVELINQFQQAMETVTQDRFEQSLTVYQQQFAQKGFWTQKQYLIWFHGKDIQKAMQRQKSQYIALDTFFDWALSQIDINQYPDLFELQNVIREI